MTETNLVETGSQAMVAPAPPPSCDLHLVARSTEEMQTAQQSLIGWYRAKILALRGEAADATDNLRIAETNGWKLNTFKRQAQVAWRRVTFYEKCLSAVEAGYAIVPNFPVDVFAVRTTKNFPRREERGYDPDFEQKGEGAAAGEGRYVDALPVVESYKEETVNSVSGEKGSKTLYYPSEFDEDVEYPVSIAQPQVMTATAEAMALKLFDEIGCLPARRRQGDPIVVGRVCGNLGGGDRKVVSFLIAWYVNTREL